MPSSGVYLICQIYESFRIIMCIFIDYVDPDITYRSSINAGLGGASRWLLPATDSSCQLCQTCLIVSNRASVQWRQIDDQELSHNANP